MALDAVDFSGYQSVPLYPCPEPICATEPRFILPQGVTLRLREKAFSISGDDFNITCANTGVEYFKCQGKVFSLREKKILRDNNGVPILNFKEQLIAITDKFNVYAGDGSDRQICKFKTKYTFIKAKMTTDFPDVCTGANRHIVLKGDWRDKRGVIYWGEPKQGGVPIAKIFRQMAGIKAMIAGTDDYCIEIAPGVDIALMVTMCIALDEHVRDSKRD